MADYGKKRRRQLARNDALYAAKRFVRLLIKVAVVSALAVGVIATGMRLGAPKTAPITLHWSITLHGLPKSATTTTAALMAASELPTITGPLIVTGKPGKTAIITYQCVQPSPFWGVGTDGNGSSIAGIIPLGNGEYSVSFTKKEHDEVWISDVPDGPGPTGCNSIQVLITTTKGHHKHDK